MIKVRSKRRLSLIWEEVYIYLAPAFLSDNNFGPWPQNLPVRVKGLHEDRVSVSSQRWHMV